MIAARGTQTHTHARTRTNTHTRTHAHAHTHTHAHTRTHTDTHGRTRTHTHTHGHTRTHTDTHGHTRTHTHTHMQRLSANQLPNPSPRSFNSLFRVQPHIIYCARLSTLLYSALLYSTLLDYATRIYLFGKAHNFPTQGHALNRKPHNPQRYTLKPKTQ